MFKKLLIVSALVLSAVAVMAAETDKPAAKKTAAKRPAETIQLSLNLSGDNEATIEVVEKSANVRPGAKVMPFRNKKPGRALGFTVIPAAKGATEVTLKLLVDILQAWRDTYAVGHGERPSLGLSGFMVRILP